MTTYDFKLASAAQDKYCETHHEPHFAPYGGICYRCGANIYSPQKRLYGAVTGCSVEYAAEHLIFKCPHCGYGFCE